jgi:hypothetical protein
MKTHTPALILFGKINITLLIFFILFANGAIAQNSTIVRQIVKEANDNSQLKSLGHELLDNIGPRLTGTPQMKEANDWAVAKYKSWGIDARNEQWGQWRGWERGVSHIDLVYPRVKSLEGMQLGWSPGTNGKTITAETIIIPDVTNSIAFQQWLPAVKGKFVLTSMAQPTGRPEENLEEFGLKETVSKIKNDRIDDGKAWSERIGKWGLSARGALVRALENAGAIGIVQSNWSQGWGVNKIFGATTKVVPMVDLSLEDYGLLYRLTESGKKPRISVRADSKELGLVPTFNTIAEIRGSEKPNEYVILSAHFDSWDGATGATDNGTGTLTMMEAARILKKVYPSPKRTILVGHWGSEEQGLNGSRAFVEDHPEIVQNIQAVFNQDNGTGRVVSLAGQGFLHSAEFLPRWVAAAPDNVSAPIQTSFPGMPGGGGSDFASFVAVGAPAFSLSSLSWSYGTYTWHTNRDTYDKIVWDDVKNNVILAATLAYMASEDPQKTPRDKVELPVNPGTGERAKWPEQKKATRKGGVD